jgi:hypothetical protein
MEKHSIEKAAAEMKDEKKLPADSEMQKAVEQAKEAGGTKKAVSAVKPLRKPR